MPALLTRTSRVSTASTARWICDALVTSSVRAVTRSSAISIGPRVPANTFFAPLRIASLTSARPMPRFAPVIRTVLFAMSIPVLLRRVMGESSFIPFYGCPPAKDTDATSAISPRRTMKQATIRIKRAGTDLCSRAAPMVMTIDPNRTRLESPGATPGTRGDGDAFLQERLAYVGRFYALIGISFYLAGNVADVLLGTFGDLSVSNYLVQRTTDVWTWVVPVAAAVYLAQWRRCRGGRLPLSVLRWIDGTSTIATASLHSLMVFSHMPGEVPG